MKKAFLLLLIIVASIVVVRAFFMPWADLSTTVVKASRQLTAAAEEKAEGIPRLKKALQEFARVTDVIDELGDIEVKTSVSGYSIPKMVNQEGSKTAISIVKIFFEDAKDLDKKSYLVYLIPLLAVVCVLLAMAGLNQRFFIIVMLFLSGGVSLVGLYNLYTLDLANLPVDIVIGNGLWYSLYAFLFIAFVSLLWLISDRQKSR